MRPITLSPSTSPNLERFVLLDGMRGIAALSVVIFHVLSRFNLPIFSSAYTAVDLFFCISGFVIGHAYFNKLQTFMTVQEFMRYRIVRLYPAFLVGSILGLAALCIKISMGDGNINNVSAAVAAILNLSFLPYLGNSKISIYGLDIIGGIFPVNNPAWTLFFELFANFLLAIWIRKASYLSLKPIVIFFGILLLVYCVNYRVIAPGSEFDNFLGGFPRSIYGIFAGFMIFYLYRKPPIKNQSALCGGILIFTVFLLSIPAVKILTSALWLASALVVGPLLVFSASRFECNGLTARFSSWLGELSYPIYCIHYPIYSLATSIIPSEFFDLKVGILCILVTVIFSHVVYLYVDVPARRFLRDRFLTY